MTAEQSLWAVLVAIYASECLMWTSAHCVCFAEWWFGDVRWAVPGRWFGNAAAGLVLAPPWPPFGPILRTRSSPVSVSAEGAYAYVAHTIGSRPRPPQAERWVGFQDADAFRANGTTVCSGERALLTLDDPRRARQVAETLERVRATPPDGRDDAIDQVLDAAADIDAVRARLDAFHSATQWLLDACLMQFIVLFVMAPVLIWMRGLEAVWLPIVAWIGVGTLAISWLFHRAHRALYPTAVAERRVHLFMMLVNPLATIRARDVLGRHLLLGFDPAAVACVLLNGTQRDHFLRAVLLDLRHPLRPVCPARLAAATAAEASFRGQRLAALERMVDRAGIGASALLAPPVAEDPSCHKYCPRCHAQFAAAVTDCVNCGDIELAAFPGLQ